MNKQSIINRVLVEYKYWDISIFILSVNHCSNSTGNTATDGHTFSAFNFSDVIPCFYLNRNLLIKQSAFYRKWYKRRGYVSIIFICNVVKKISFRNQLINTLWNFHQLHKNKVVCLEYFCWIANHYILRITCPFPIKN